MLLHLRILGWILARVLHPFPDASETPPRSALAFHWLLESLKSYGEFFLAFNKLCDTQFIGFGFAVTKFIDFGFAIAEPSPEVPSSPPLWHGTLLSVWKKDMAAREHREIYDIQQTKKMLPLITCEASFGYHVSKVALGVSTFDLNLWVHVNSVTQPIKRNSGFLTRRLQKNVCWWERDPRATTDQRLGFPFCFGLDVRSLSGSRRQFPALGFWVLVLFVERNTSITHIP